MRERDGRLDDGAVVAAVERHAALPKGLEKVGQHLRADVLWLHAIGGDALLDHFQHDLLHLLVGRGELALQDDHHLARVVERVLGVHERDDEADRLQVRRQDLAAQRADAAPERLEHVVERLDAVGAGRLGERGERERGDRLDLLVLVLEPALDDVDARLQVRQHGAAHEDRDLLHDLDARVARLPALLAQAHRLEERQQRGDAQRAGDDAKRARCGVAHVLVDVVDVWPHGGDHLRQASGLGEVGDDLAALDARVVVLVD